VALYLVEQEQCSVSMADALDKVMNMMLPNLESSQMANLLGVDTVRKARGRGLLDAGLTAMALAGPRPANENVNTAMILKQMVDQGTNTYDKAIDRATSQLQTTTALQDEVQKKETFYKLLQSDYVNDEQRAFALTLGPKEGATFLTNAYMENQKAGNKYIDVVRIADGKEMRVTQNEYIKNIDVYSTGSKLAIEKKMDKAGITDPEERKEIIKADIMGQQIIFGADGSVTIGKGLGSGTLEKGTKKNLEQQIINNSVNFEGFKEIKELYRPEFSQLPTKWKIWYKKIQDGLGDWSPFGDISEEDKKLISDYSAWEQKSWEMTNAYIKSITGAQMSEKEAERILKGFADPRKLSPTEYQAKLNGILENAMKSTIRYNLILRSGLQIPTDVNGNLNPEAIMTLSSVDKYVNDIGSELKLELQLDDNWKDKSEEEIDLEVKRQLKLLMYGNPDNNVFTLENLR
jgi:hypothetical protein